MKLFNRYEMNYKPLDERESKINISETSVNPQENTLQLTADLEEKMTRIAHEIINARKKGASVILAFGAHTIKNGLGRVLTALAEEGWITHLATNGAGIIHDWEFAFAGKSSEDVRVNAALGQFGAWEETGLYINLALVAGAYKGLGYGEAVGAMIEEGLLTIPSRKELEEILTDSDQTLWKRAAAADFLDLICREELREGVINLEHPFKEYSIQARAFRAGIPFTSHPMIGHDIIYTHHSSRGAAVGRCGERDFLSYAQSVSQLEGGVYLSVGSAVMSPMIFEKSLSMARNIKQQKGRDIKNCNIHVIDLAEETWDWSRGEPPADHPAYYLRYMKTFSRMGCPVDYTSLDNKVFLPRLYRKLKEIS